MINTLDLKKELTFEEVKHFFSQTAEYEVSEHDEHGTIKINLKVTSKVEYERDADGFMKTPLVPNYEYVNIDTLVYKPTLQTLIRDIASLGYRNHLEVGSKI
jgi:hypothetical protein